MSRACKVAIVLALAGCDTSVPLALPADGGTITTFAIPKVGSYTGPHLDPQLDKLRDCPDFPLEPNDDRESAIDLTNSLGLALDANSPTLKQVAICPVGVHAGAPGHDVDMYRFDVAVAAFVLVEVTYDIRFGDLDAAILDANGTLLIADAASVDNACLAANLSPGTHYAAIAGAHNVDSNRYDLRIRYRSQPVTCGAGGSPE